MTEKIKYYFIISTSSGVPIYRQVVDQVKTHIAMGDMEEGGFLPSVRQVSKALEINPMTVSKAYSLLEKEGVLEFVRGKGMKVQKSKLPKKNLLKREEELKLVLKEVVVKAKQLSFGADKVIDIFEKTWKEQQGE